MTDDLVKRLREIGDRNGFMYADYDTTVEAADRIEKLEAALREIALHPDPYLYNDEMAIIARKALEGKDD